MTLFKSKTRKSLEILLEMMHKEKCWYFFLNGQNFNNMVHNHNHAGVKGGGSDWGAKYAEVGGAAKLLVTDIF